MKTLTKPTSQFSAAFELRGTPENGELTLFTPLGTTYAQVVWQPGAADLHDAGSVKKFENLDKLTTALIGAPLPITTLFAWLSGTMAVAEGWQIDLRETNTGLLIARRHAPEPQTEIRLVLDNTRPLPP